uniref:protein FAR1-RELATED SEQUENCE 11-like n=1 Tax=Erigeron canadensis TaxID=72917 RepID=UPI001CB8B4F7|nr:protein FAR1-RELATED SEQUENCE 11-like [Erigeron canadensis]
MFDLNNLPDDDYDENIIDETLNNEPFIGQTFSTFQEAFVFYENYAKQYGFTVRKDRSHKRNDTTVRRDICCHREGKKRLKLVDLSKNQRNRGSIKCECNAHMRVTLKRSCDIFPEEWHVTTFVKDHNHELLSPDEMRYLPANRIITPEDERQILLYKEAGLNVRQIINVMELQKQVKHGDLSFQEKDVHNLFARVKRALGDNDAMELINYMEASKEKNNKFHYEYTVDEDMRLENIFWCHPQSFDWYEKFGDVIVFDTTYKVNAYDMSCALFVGINNHGKTVLFASALLRNETVKTFTWLMKTFVAIMKKPSQTIITDQDPWMTEAIATEMPTTKHSFCIWHITTKFSCWFAALLRTQYQNWCGDFYTLYKMTSIEEFEHSWPLIVSKYNLQKNNHVQGLYKIRKSWAPAYLRNYFFGGMKSTSTSESINAFIKRFVFSRTSLREFVKQVDLAVEEIGIREAKDKMSTTLTHVPLKTKSPLEEQAYGILTPFAFNKFQVEFQRANQYSIVCVEESHEICMQFFKKYPCAEEEWDLHVLPTDSIRPVLAETFPKSSLMESFVPFGGFFSMPSDIKSPLRVSSHFGSLCHICDEKFKLEVNDVSQGGLTGSVSDHCRSNLPSWLQMSQLSANSEMDMVQYRDSGTVQRQSVQAETECAGRQSDRT